MIRLHDLTCAGLRLSFFLALLPFALSAASSLELQTENGQRALVWEAASDTYYFVQQTDDLLDSAWSYLTFAALGEGLETSTAISSLPTGSFFRLEFHPTDISPLPPVLSANFDGDFLNNKEELDFGTDLFDLTFSDADVLADEWELFYFGRLAPSEAENTDGDLTNNIEEYQLQLDPLLNETGLALTYTYDDLGRLTGVTGNETTLSYSFDEEGNITTSN